MVIMCGVSTGNNNKDAPAVNQLYFGLYVRILRIMNNNNNATAVDWGPDGTTGSLLRNVHSGLPHPDPDQDPTAGTCALVRGDYLYYHYGCDGQDDRGWGCGYRTVQTLASWLCLNGGGGGGRPPPPSLRDIQRALVSMGDKPAHWQGSRGWIGTFEASLVLDRFYDVPCRLVHVRGGGEELEEVAVPELRRHFESHGSPVMMGGDRDNSSKGIVGVSRGGTTGGSSSVLVLDPHYFGRLPRDNTELQTQGWVAWKPISSLDQCSFYNLCLPLTSK